MDVLNLAAEERVNLADLSFALTDSILGQNAELAQGLFLPSAAAPAASVVAGFMPAAASTGGPVTVGQANVVNSAFLARLATDGSLRPAELIYGGTSVVSIDISTFPTNSYGIFVRGSRTEQAVQNRAFWSGVDASEYAQLTPTRLTASWEVRIETASPGAEWLRIGQADITAAQSGGQGATVVVTDQRPLFFEGIASAGYAPTWGSASDRSDRRANAITNLAQMVDALKQCIVDIKGRGLATWSQPNISGLQVGTAFTLTSRPTANRLSIGDENFYLGFTKAVNPFIGDSDTLTIALNGDSDRIVFVRNGGFLTRQVNGSAALILYNGGGAVFGAGASAAFVTINPTSKYPLYGFAVRTAEATTNASLGIVSTASTRAFIELGKGNGVGNGYGYIGADWISTPQMTFAVNGAPFMYARANSFTDTPTVEVQGNVSLEGNVSAGGPTNSLTLLGRTAAPGGVVWAVGYYSVGQGAVFASCNSGITAQGGSNSTGGVNITFSSNLPTSQIVSITTLITNSGNAQAKNLSASYSISGPTLTVMIRNDNAEPVQADFSFVVFYGP